MKKSGCRKLVHAVRNSGKSTGPKLKRRRNGAQQDESSWFKSNERTKAMLEASRALERKYCQESQVLDDGTIVCRIGSLTVGLQVIDKQTGRPLTKRYQEIIWESHAKHWTQKMAKRREDYEKAYYGNFAIRKKSATLLIFCGTGATRKFWRKNPVARKLIASELLCLRRCSTRCQHGRIQTDSTLNFLTP
jgi:hypothetical protein